MSSLTATSTPFAAAYSIVRYYRQHRCVHGNRVFQVVVGDNETCEPLNNSNSILRSTCSECLPEATRCVLPDNPDVISANARMAALTTEDPCEFALLATLATQVSQEMLAIGRNIAPHSSVVGNPDICLLLPQHAWDSYRGQRNKARGSSHHELFTADGDVIQR